MEDMKKFISVAVVFALALLIVGEAQVGQAMTCNPNELSACAPAITSRQPPSATCCAKLQGQRPCLCQYVNNPNLKHYVNSPNAQRVAATCHVSLPKC